MSNKNIFSFLLTDSQELRKNEGICDRFYDPIDKQY